MEKQNQTILSAHPIDPAIRQRVMQALADIEVRHDVKVLFACESGSRGWGFASPDSDYDVRFLYVHRLPWYLAVEAGRDVIELPIRHRHRRQLHAGLANHFAGPVVRRWREHAAGQWRHP